MIKPNFKMTKFHYRGKQEAEFLQKAMFALGFCWAYKATGEQREINGMIPDNGFLYVNEDCRIMYSGESYGLSADSYEFASTFAVTLFAAANAFKAAKRVERKASRKRAAARRQAASTSEGWVNWNIGKGFRYEHGKPSWSGYLPLGTLVDVKFRDGTITENLKAGVDTRASGAFWVDEDSPRDIVAYRVVPVAAPAVEGPFFEADTPAVEQFVVQAQPDTNPKRQYGVSSVPLNMWSQLASAYGALALYNGALKYGKANFANTPVEASIYVAAAQRHLAAWAAGEEFDPADGVPNLGGVLANIAILLESRAAGMLIDDRLKMDGYLKERDALKDIVKMLNELHADKTPKHYTMEAP